MPEVSQQLVRLGVNPGEARYPVSTLDGVILHLVTFSWRRDVTNDDVVSVIEGLSSLPAQIPELLSYRFGPDLGLREGNADFAVAAVLESPDSLPAYLDHVEHQRIVTEIIAPLVATRQAVQIELPADSTF
ncbi:MAG: Dabb family protein [Geodermatophilaceae bacterium]